MAKVGNTTNVPVIGSYLSNRYRSFMPPSCYTYDLGRLVHQKELLISRSTVFWLNDWHECCTFFFNMVKQLSPNNDTVGLLL